MSKMDKVDVMGNKIFSLERNEIIDNKWCVQDELGQGAFGKVYSVIGTIGQKAVLKIEFGNNRRTNLRQEYEIMNEIIDSRESGDCKTFPVPITRPADYGKHDNRRFIVLKPHGMALSELQSQNRFHRFKYKTVYTVAVHILYALEAIHKAGYVHLDIKPENIIAGISKENDGKVFLSDFGLATKFIKNGCFLPDADEQSRRGTPIFRSRKMDRYLTPGPREDLESLGYTIIFMLKGSLPWESDKVEVSIRKKSHRERKTLCEGLPVLKKYFDIIDPIPWGEWPDYRKLRSLFENAVVDELRDRVRPRCVLEWEPPLNNIEGYLAYNDSEFNNVPKRKKPDGNGFTQSLRKKFRKILCFGA